MKQTGHTTYETDIQAAIKIARLSDRYKRDLAEHGYGNAENWMVDRLGASWTAKTSIVLWVQNSGY